MSPVTQAAGNGISPRIISRPAATPARWYTEPHLHAQFNARLQRYQINSVKFTDGTFLITSNNIYLSVKSRGNELQNRFNWSPEGAARTIRTWRIKKNDDDELAYEQGTPAIKGTAKRIRRRSPYDDIGYYLCEQHCVWAMGASARTGCIIPPEFFIDHEAYGGTAGNGPDIQFGIGGYIGGAASTISMAHDTDWMIGRLFQMGPLAGLAPIRPQSLTQARRLGASGLFRANDPIIPWPVRGENNAPIDNYINSCFNRDIIFMTNDWIAVGRNALRLGYDGWWVRYKDDGFGDFRAFIDITWKHNFQWDGNRGQSEGRNDIRYWNSQMTPYFSDMQYY